MNPILVPAVAFFCVGVMMMHTMGVPFWRVWRARRWDSTAGRVLSASLDTARIDGPGDADANTATPVIRYEYTVDSRRYEGRRVNFVGFSLTEAVHAKIRYEDTPEVTVWYDPNDPSSSVLERCATPRGVLFGLLALTAFAVSTVFLLDTMLSTR